MKRILLTLTCILTFYSSIQAQFSGSGSGTGADPYRIFNAEQLNQVRNFTGDNVYFSLEADIDMTDWIAENNPNQGWLPIPDFHGTFRGNGHKITNLMINRPTTDYIGLFGNITGRIYNVYVLNANYVGNDYVGGIAAYGGNINGCIFQGKIKGDDYVGGICAYTELYIENCYSFIELEGHDYCGGIVGYIVEGTLSGDYCHAVLLRGNRYIGGIAGFGYNRFQGTVTIDESYTTGNIAGSSCIGGIIGKYKEGIVGNCTLTNVYSNCNKISGLNDVGGILGENDYQACTIINSVAINKIISANSELYRVGQNKSSSNRSWNQTKMFLNDEEQPMPDDSNENGINTGLSALKLKATYQGMSWDFDNIWEIQETETFPYLKTQTAPPYFTQTLKAGDTHLEGSCVEAGTIIVRVGDKTFSTQSTGNTWSIDVDELTGGECVMIIAQTEGKMPSYVITATVGYTGEGTEESPYIVSTADDLHNITESGYYKLANDIDVSGWIEENNAEGGWSPIGGIGPALAITLDGDGHTVSGLRCDAGYTHTGLFAKIAKDGIVKNLKIELADGNVYTESNSFGAIVGLNKGIISNCEVIGTVSDGLNIGGIAGENMGTIERCHTAGSISSATTSASVGGICGNVSTGNITDCYSDMAVITTATSSYGGGIAGKNNGSITKCYAAGNIEGNYIGGIVGYNTGADAAISECFALNREVTAENVGTRVLGGFSSNSKAPGMDNYATENMVVSVNGRPQTIYDDPMNGTSMTESALKGKTAYESAGWDFTNVWKINEGTSWPYQEAFNVPVTSISVSETEANIETGKTLELTVTIAPDDARNKTVTWSSSDETVATVSQEGTVTAVKAGEATITAATNDGTELTASCKITVTPKLATSIKLDKERLEMEAGATETLKATVLPEDAGDRTVTWSSSDETVATVSHEGTVTAVKAGEATITATTNDGTGLTASCIVKVNETSGIGNVYADGITVAGGKGCITISGTADNIMTSVYTANGTTVYTGTDTTISVGAPGLYIVKTDGNTYKVIVK